MLLKKILSYKNVLYVYALVLIVVNIFLTQLPLTSTFGYEFAALNGLILSILTGLNTLNFVNKSEFSLNELAKTLFILFLIPFAISVINSLLTLFCSFIDGLMFYILIVPASISFGTALAFIISLIAKKYSKLIFFISLILFAIIPMLEIYFNPQVYFYSPLIGFFPGNIYDEGLSPDWTLFFHQLLVIISSLSIIFIVIKKNNIVD